MRSSGWVASTLRFLTEIEKDVVAPAMDRAVVDAVAREKLGRLMLDVGHGVRDFKFGRDHAATSDPTGRS